MLYLPTAGASVLKALVLCQQCLGDCHILFFSWSRQNGLVMSHTLTHKCCPGCGQNNIPTVNSCLGSPSKLWKCNFPYIEEWGLDGHSKGNSHSASAKKITICSCSCSRRKSVNGHVRLVFSVFLMDLAPHHCCYYEIQTGLYGYSQCPWLELFSNSSVSPCLFLLQTLTPPLASFPGPTQLVYMGAAYSDMKTVYKGAAYSDGRGHNNTGLWSFHWLGTVGRSYYI